MKKKILLFMISLMLVLPMIAYAESDSAGGGSSGGNITCSDNCVGWTRSGAAGGVRITFIDANGKILAGTESYDFLTHATNSSLNKRKVVYNHYKGAKHRFGHNYKGEEEVGLTSLPKLVDLINNYNNQPGVTKYSVNANETGGNWYDGFGKERQWFLAITKRGIPNYASNVSGLVHAIAAHYPIPAEELIDTIKSGCGKTGAIFIIMEPLVYYTESNEKYFLGTISDYIAALGVLPPNANASAYLLYYDTPLLPAAGFQAADVVPKGTPIFNSVADVTNRAGWGFIIDWANSGDDICNDFCSFDKDTGKVIVDGKTYPGTLTAPPGYDSLEKYLYDEEGANCCSVLGDYYDNLPTQELKDAYHKYCEKKACSIVDYGTGFVCKDGEQCSADEYNKQCASCCTENPINPEPERSIINCCEEDTHSYIRQADLDDLFCYDDGVKVDYYFPKCQAEEFKTDSSPNEYCDIYCSERMTVDMPRAITATSGRYFELAEGAQGYRSPYIEAFKRCRVRVKFDDWENDYRKQVDNQVKNYNSFQENTAKAKVYESAVASQISGTVSTHGTCKKTYSCNTNSSGKCTDTTSVSGTASYSYTKYTFGITSKDYYSVKIDETLLKKYNAYKIKTDKKLNYKHAKFSVYGLSDAISAVEAKADSLSCPSGYSLTSSYADSLPDEGKGYDEENVPEELAKYQGNAATANDNYLSATGTAKDLEDKLDVCDKWFTKYDGGNLDLEENQFIQPELNFHYQQIYLNDAGYKQLDDTYVDFEGAFDKKVCKYSINTDAPSEYTMNASGSTVSGIDNSEDRYSAKYGEGVMNLNDFKKGQNITFQTSNTINSALIDDTYEADKKFTHDATYKAECAWEEKDSEVCTLVPSGEVMESTSEIKYYSTKHKRQYRIFLTTFDGKYQTYYDLSGLGTKGKFDRYFKEGEMCSKESANNGTTASMTCTLHVEYETILTGRCGDGSETITDPEKCDDPNKEGMNLFAFRIVDEANVFPSGTNINGVEIAKNWTYYEEARQVKAEIENIGAKKETYNPKYLSYNFVLTPSDMRHIKNYNVEHVDTGGYSDFNMSCSCPQEPVPCITDGDNKTCKNTEACTKCLSNFLTGLARDNVRYDNNDHKVDIWHSNKSIDKIRDGLKW